MSLIIIIIEKLCLFLLLSLLLGGGEVILVINLLEELCLVSKEIKVAVVGLCLGNPFQHHLVFLLFRV